MALTKLKLVLMREGITQRELCEITEEIELEKSKPGVHPATMSVICTGDRKNPTKSTMDKILVGINAILEKRGQKNSYTIGDIFD